MIIPGNKIKEINKLRVMLIEIQEIILSISVEDLKSKVVANDWSDNPDDSALYGNWNFSLYNKHYIIPSPPPIFKNIEDQLGTIPDVFQSFINFMKPNSVLPIHSDDESLAGNMGTLRSAGFKTYQITAGVVIPSSDPSICGLEINGVTTGTEQNDIIAFDGSVPHRGWNHSSSWRITWIIDMYKTGFLN